MHASAEDLKLLAALLAQPADDGLDLLRHWLPGHPWLAPAIDELAGLPLAEWQAEHTRLFVNGYPKTPCPPFESAYREGRMGGTSGEQLRDLYRRVGLAATGAPSDYLGALLECAAYLTGQCGLLQPPLKHTAAPAGTSPPGTAGESPCTLLATLWHDHLGRWLPRFAQDLQDAAQLRLYRLLGERLAALSAPDQTSQTTA
jgi:TorA maturation chaperone TorD